MSPIISKIRRLDAFCHSCKKSFLVFIGMVQICTCISVTPCIYEIEECNHRNEFKLQDKLPNIKYFILFQIKQFQAILSNILIYLEVVMLFLIQLYDYFFILYIEFHSFVSSNFKFKNIKINPSPITEKNQNYLQSWQLYREPTWILIRYWRKYCLANAFTIRGRWNLIDNGTVSCF